jgi:hypothetical protein
MDNMASCGSRVEHMAWASTARTTLKDLDYNNIFLIIISLPLGIAHAMCSLHWVKCSLRFNYILQPVWWLALAVVTF